MKSYNFKEASILTKFIENNKNQIVGHTIKKLYTEYWPAANRMCMSDCPVILEIDNYCIEINYLIPSDLTLTIATKDELSKNLRAKRVIDARNEVIDYFNEQFGEGVPRELIEECEIKKVEIERFSDSFECNTAGDMRPEGGDYFSDIKLHLNSGRILCFCGAESLVDGYIYIWCE